MHKLYDSRMFRNASLSVSLLYFSGNDGTYLLHIGSIKKGSRVLHGKRF